MRDCSLLESMLYMAVESHMAHCDAALRRLQLPGPYSDYGCQNENYKAHVVQKSRQCDWGFRG